jgi:hypothetical protein
MATLAYCKVVTPKRALAVMTSHTACSATGRMMIERLRHGHLSSLRHTRPYLVTFFASNFLVF